MTRSKATLERSVSWVLFGACLAAYAYIFYFRWELPPVWNDEIHFLIPAAPLFSGRLFDTGAMMMPGGIYWLPSGFYIENSIFSQLLGDSLTTARTAALIWLLGSAAILGRALNACLPHRPMLARIAPLTWLLALPVALAGNLARPESIVIFISLSTLLFAQSGRPLAAASAAVLALLVHPLLAAPALVICALAIVGGVRTERPPTPLGTYVLMAAAALLALWEAHQFLSHQQLYAEHLQMQYHRKADREVGALPVIVGLCLAAGAVSFVVRRYFRIFDRVSASTHLAAVAGLAFGFVFFFGKEMWYWPYLITGAFLMLPLALQLAERWLGEPMAGRVAISGLITAALATWAYGAVGDGFMKFSVNPAVLSQIKADRRFVDALVDRTIADHPKEKVSISPFLGGRFISEFHRPEPALLTRSPLSGPMQDVGTAIYLESNYAGLIETINDLAPGYTTTQRRAITSPHGNYRVIIERVAAPRPDKPAAPRPDPKPRG